MLSTLEKFFKQGQEKIEIFNTWARTYKLTDKVAADHFGYKCSTANEFEQIRKLFENNSDYIFQSIISKRRISIIKLIKPVETNCGQLFFLELSDQKPDGSQKSGFDHVEIFPNYGSAEELVKYLTDQNIFAIKANRPHHITHDIALKENFNIRIEPESLISKIVRDEILSSLVKDVRTAVLSLNQKYYIPQYQLPE